MHGTKEEEFLVNFGESRLKSDVFSMRLAEQLRKQIKIQEPEIWSLIKLA